MFFAVNKQNQHLQAVRVAFLMSTIVAFNVNGLIGLSFVQWTEMTTYIFRINELKHPINYFAQESTPNTPTIPTKSVLSFWRFILCGALIKTNNKIKIKAYFYLMMIVFLSFGENMSTFFFPLKTVIYGFIDLFS